VKTAAVVVNYRTPALTARIVDALLRELEPRDAKVFLVDNASDDGSLAHFAAQGWGERVQVIASPRNGGYGYAINLAVQHALAPPGPPEYIYVLNSDAYPDPGTLAQLVRTLEADPRVGIVGSRIHGPDGVTQVSALRFPTVLGELEQTARTRLLTRLLRRHVIAMDEPQASCEVDWVSGTSFLVRRQVFAEVGGFDEGFFLYFEETDFCHQARKLGWQVRYVAGAPVTHLGSVSTGVANLARRMPRYWFESRRRYLRKHHGPAYAAACDGAWLLGQLLWRGKQRLLFRRAPDHPHLLSDFFTASVRGLIDPSAISRRLLATIFGTEPRGHGSSRVF
jgi:N-acetylglucosaminyl-diphospho-decaprenol L-rhamnosyltransferase